MQISLNWLRDYVDIEVDPDTLAGDLTRLGLEIESVARPGADIQGVRVGRIESIQPHPDADKLVVCKTSVGEGEPLQIVCGAKNMKEGDKVPTATVGAMLPGGFEIGRRKMRGQESQGMMCSGRELGISEDHAGLLLLPQDAPLGADIVSYLGLDDVVYEIEVTPNRNDWASMLGVARELAALYGKELRIPPVAPPEDGTPASELSSVTIEAPEQCPRYAGRVLTHVTVGPSPDWMKQRLVAAGQRPINNIVDITNYVLLETGHPLHAFDYQRLAEHRIVVRLAREGERIVTIDDEDRALTTDMLVIADAERPVAVAGIMGGNDSEVGDATTSVFLESAWFDPIIIRRTARQLGMTTEASQRFQRGADPEMVPYALNRAAQLMHEIAGARIAPGLLDEYPRPAEPRAIALRHARACHVLGDDVSAGDQRRYLEGLGFVRGENGGEGADVYTVPSWRHDCQREEDLIEEVARFHGYDRVPVRMPAVRQNETVFAPYEAPIRALRDFLVGLGLTEVVNMSFGSPAANQRAGLDADAMVTLQNPLAETAAGMRTSLVPGILANVRDNINHGAADLKLFEFGSVYANEGDALPAQRTRLTIALTGRREPRHWSAPDQPAVDFYDIKGLAECLYGHFDLPLTLEGKTNGPLVRAESAGLLLGNDTVGAMGRVEKDVLRAYDIEQPVFLLDLDILPLLASAPGKAQLTPIASYPPSLRDLAVVVDTSVPAGDILRIAREAGGKYLKRVEVFDVYTGEQVSPGKKSIALSLVFQSTDQTLSDKVTQKASDSIIRKLKDAVGAELR